jgi:uncharacterized protein (DUF362 family)
MCLDLQQILHYGTLEGNLAATPQRTVLTITDAIIAGEGEGPLAPEPFPLGLLTLGTSTAALEWVHALLMGFDPHRIPLVREAFRLTHHPLAEFSPEQIEVQIDGQPVELSDLPRLTPRFCKPPAGWAGHCELV